MALLTLKGHNEEKVEFSAAYVRKELENVTGEIPDLLLAGPAPAPLARAESNYRYQLMIRTNKMPRLSEVLSRLQESLTLPDGITLSIDIDPVNLA